MKRSFATVTMAAGLLLGGAGFAQASPPPPAPNPSPQCSLLGGPIWYAQQKLGIDPYGLSQAPLAVALRNLSNQVC
ncbi:hypothetical protein [Nocardia sp. BMG51109]|uniref:hypothetical protein n=1 Tax=Nocardia sp. BMG51109 TaxID=1056816 RepID=UPI0012EBC45C|nr:hypothetical protein [Nocardia sp. BMG51109]